MDASRLILRAGVIATAFAAFTAISQPASAVSVSDGTILRVDFDANTVEGPVSAYLDIFVNQVSSTIFDLNVKVTNDTPIPPSSSFSAFSINTTPNATSLQVFNPAADDFGDDRDGLNWGVVGGFVPGSGVTLDYCTGTANNCQSANEGLVAGLMDRLTLRLTFGAALDEFDLGTFAGRFARIDPNDADLSIGVPGTTTVIPVPASLPLLFGALAGLGFIGRRRRSA